MNSFLSLSSVQCGHILTQIVELNPSDVDISPGGHFSGVGHSIAMQASYTHILLTTVPNYLLDRQPFLCLFVPLGFGSKRAKGKNK